MSDDWPDDLDALVAAPDHHTLLLENDHVRVLDTQIAPGCDERRSTRTAGRLRSTCCPATHFVRRDGDGHVLLDTRESEGLGAGAAFWSAPFPPHTLENVGAAEIHVIAVELKEV